MTDPVTDSFSQPGDGSSGPGPFPSLGSEFWQQRYQAGTTRWDLGQPAPAFITWLSATNMPPAGQVVVPGSGRGHDALLFARYGFEVTAVDFAAGAIAATRAQAEADNLPVDCLQRNIFDLTPEYSRQFDYVVEHTCFCALDPALWPDYVELVADLLKPGGQMIAVFFTHNRPGGPPFGVSLEQIEQLFLPRFNLLRLEPVRNSLPSRQGDEHFAQLLKRPT